VLAHQTACEAIAAQAAGTVGRVGAGGVDGHAIYFDKISGVCPGPMRQGEATPVRLDCWAGATPAIRDVPWLPVKTTSQ
jgi:hypothetical protein